VEQPRAGAPGPPGGEDLVAWPDEVDGILGGDLTVAVGMPTPKGGVVLASVTPLGLRDREVGTVGFTTSLGFGRKLERIAADPRIAVLYHTRDHGSSSRPGVVLVQGVATIQAEFDDEERARLRQQASDHIGQVVEGRFWDWWLATYYQDRVLVHVHARRILWWPDGDLAQDPRVLGAPLPLEPPSEQSTTTDMARARVPMEKVAKGLRHPHRVLGVLQHDGLPLLVPFRVAGVDGSAVGLEVDSPLLPAGERRAGVLAHDFRAKLLGLATATHTGWLRVDPEGARWWPHTRHAFAAPPNKTLLLLGNGAAARWGYRQAIKQGRDEILRHATSR
jgi:hypothetical protein